MSFTRTLAFGSLAALAAGVLPSGAVALAADQMPRLSAPSDRPVADADTPPPIPAQARAGAVWYVVIDGEKVGPLTEEGLMARLDRGEINADTLIWKSGMGDWQRVADNHPIMAKRVAAAIRDMKPKTPLDEKFSPLI